MNLQTNRQTVFALVPPSGLRSPSVSQNLAFLSQTALHQNIFFFTAIEKQNKLPGIMFPSGMNIQSEYLSMRGMDLRSPR